ncbi:cation diffusion facilitator family transporter [Corynebacterium sp.]|uniref:cation diffusion facilitator family transporter n=1 Tax=Corynebacterium sp. TaxID=1720 RepID=UPI002A91C04C|nr:cation diffusion facilitator family transporter [Corynebacterium sp.]MDY5785765.1 cation diffusion facilitator family transporter [Corynebacterium sp.]
MTHVNQGHAHSHDTHSHGPAAGTPLRALALALSITTVVLAAELVGGWLTGSVALMADAVHMLSDATGLIIATIAVFIGRRATTPAATFGYRRVEVLAALVNAVTVLGMSAWIVVEALRRLSSPTEILAGPMMVVAVVGLAANAACALILSRHRDTSINVEGAYLHVLVDLLGSVAVMVAGAVIYVTGWQAADVIASLLIAVMVLPRAWSLFAQSARVLLEQTPRGIDVAQVEPVLRAVDGVAEVHDLHLWSVDGTSVLASAHLVVPEDRDSARVLCLAQHRLKDAGIGHSTIQIERPGHDRHEGLENIC